MIEAHFKGPNKDRRHDRRVLKKIQEMIEEIIHISKGDRRVLKQGSKQRISSSVTRNKIPACLS